MDLLILIDGKWRICAPLDGGLDIESCSLVAELVELKEGNYEATAAGMVQRMQRCSDVGPHQMSVDHCHLADANEKIYEFVRGDHRLFFFVANDGAVVVCSGIGIKKSRKANKRDVAAAVRLKDEFLRQEAAKRVNYVKGGADVFA